MKTATITEVKNGLSAVIDRVRAGETVVVTDRGIPVARIEPMTSGTDAAPRRSRLERAGLLRVARHPLPAEVLAGPRATVATGVSAVAAVLDERRESR